LLSFTVGDSAILNVNAVTMVRLIVESLLRGSRARAAASQTLEME
jgi:hypothetical protein